MLVRMPWCSAGDIVDFSLPDLGTADRIVELRARAAAAGVPESRLEPGFHKRILEMTGSDDTLDRYNSRILVDGKLGERAFGAGWQLENFLKNPVFMPAHDYADWPIGQAVSVYADHVGRGKNIVKRLRFVILFADESENPLAEKILKLYRGKFLRSSSVGFVPKLAAYFAANEQEALELGLPHGDDLYPRPRLLAENELLELSAVPIPGNPNVAGSNAASVTVTDEERIGLERLAEVAEELVPELTMEIRSALPSTTTTIDLAGAGAELTERDIDALLGGLAEQFPVGNLPTPPTEDRDDRPSIETLGESMAEARGVPKNVSNEIVEDKAEAWKTPALSDFASDAWDDLSDDEKNRIAGHYAWADGSPPSSFGGLLLGHHRPADGKIVFRGVIAALGRLGQTELPEGDVSAVRAHLTKERERFTDDEGLGDVELETWKILADLESRQAFEPQTLIFPKRYWSLDRARTWAAEHELRHDKVDETVVSYRFRQRAPADFLRLRTMCLMPGGAAPDDEECRVKAVGGPVRESVEVAESRLPDALDRLSTRLEDSVTMVERSLDRIDFSLSSISDLLGLLDPTRTPASVDAPPGGGADVRPASGSDIWGRLLDVAEETTAKLKR